MNIVIPKTKFGGLDDARGIISNLVLSEEPGDIGGVELILSKAGTVRSNHWHRTDSHTLFVLSGTMLYYERPVGASSMPELRAIRAGASVFTGPNVEHCTRFPEETLLLCVSRLPRDHVTHEADLVRLPYDLSRLGSGEHGVVE